MDAATPFDLAQALRAVAHGQARFLRDVANTTQELDPAPLEALRRWQEQLTRLKLALHRAESLLLHYLRAPAHLRPWRELPGPASEETPQILAWHQALVRYTNTLGLETAYRCVSDPGDLLCEAETADALTDLVTVATLCQQAGQAMERFALLGDPNTLEDLAFYHVLSPWKRRGLPALMAVLVWIDRSLAEHDTL